MKEFIFMQAEKKATGYEGEDKKVWLFATRNLDFLKRSIQKGCGQDLLVNVAKNDTVMKKSGGPACCIFKSAQLYREENIRQKEESMKNFPEQFKELNEWMEKLGMAAPDVMKGFGALHEASLKSGALDPKTKELIALGIAITVRCDGCIAYHVHDALKAGAGKEEIVETVSVAILMGGGPSVVYGVEAMQALVQYQEQGL
jgi:AhpD family alkylhydroperoxidase